MPKSRIRKKADFTPPPAAKPVTFTMRQGQRWIAPLMLALFVVGLAWIVVFYVTTGSMPIEAIGNWNIVIGFGFIAGGFVVSTQWK